MTVYFKHFENKNDVLHQFSITENELKGCEILYAYYSYEDYSGEALVILSNPDNHTLYEVNGSHCSCYGLEGQWEMEETTYEALMKRESEFFNGEVKAFIQQKMIAKEVEDIKASKPHLVHKAKM